MKRKKPGQLSKTSLTVTFRVSNTAWAWFNSEFKRQGFKSVRAFIRAILESQTSSTGMYVSLDPRCVIDLEYVAKKKGIALNTYCTQLLEARSFFPDQSFHEYMESL